MWMYHTKMIQRFSPSQATMLQWWKGKNGIKLDLFLEVHFWQLSRGQDFYLRMIASYLDIVKSGDVLCSLVKKDGFNPGSLGSNHQNVFVLNWQVLVYMTSENGLLKMLNLRALCNWREIWRNSIFQMKRSDANKKWFLVHKLKIVMLFRYIQHHKCWTTF